MGGAPLAASLNEQDVASRDELAARKTMAAVVKAVSGTASRAASVKRAARAAPLGLTFGGHSLVACGFDDEKEALLVRNSWSRDWGDDGYGWLSYD